MSAGTPGGFPCDCCTMEFVSLETLHVHKEKCHKVRTRTRITELGKWRVCKAVFGPSL